MQKSFPWCRRFQNEKTQPLPRWNHKLISGLTRRNLLYQYILVENELRWVSEFVNRQCCKYIVMR